MADPNKSDDPNLHKKILLASLKLVFVIIEVITNHTGIF